MHSDAVGEFLNAIFGNTPDLIVAPGGARTLAVAKGRRARRPL